LDWEWGGQGKQKKRRNNLRLLKKKGEFGESAKTQSNSKLHYHQRFMEEKSGKNHDEKQVRKKY